MTFVQIGEFDWLSVRQKGSSFVKMFKNLLRHHKAKKMFPETSEYFLGSVGRQLFLF